jgi:hypothetical protein
MMADAQGKRLGCFTHSLRVAQWLARPSYGQIDRRKLSLQE